MLLPATGHFVKGQARELNPERRGFNELLWHTGAAQSDAAFLMAVKGFNENVIFSVAAAGIAPAISLT